ncbi:hypothetical protein NPIL_625761, partial [Nephila pilipes]
LKKFKSRSHEKVSQYAGTLSQRKTSKSSEENTLQEEEPQRHQRSERRRQAEGTGNRTLSRVSRRTNQEKKELQKERPLNKPQRRHENRFSEGSRGEAPRRFRERPSAESSTRNSKVRHIKQIR